MAYGQQNHYQPSPYGYQGNQGWPTSGNAPPNPGRPGQRPYNDGYSYGHPDAMSGAPAPYPPRHGSLEADFRQPHMPTSGPGGNPPYWREVDAQYHPPNGSARAQWQQPPPPIAADGGYGLGAGAEDVPYAARTQLHAWHNGSQRNEHHYPKGEDRQGPVTLSNNLGRYLPNRSRRRLLQVSLVLRSLAYIGLLLVPSSPNSDLLQTSQHPKNQPPVPRELLQIN